MEIKEKDCKKTKFSLLLMNITEEPLIAFYTLLPFILTKELKANAFQLSLFLMLRPVLSSFSFFWGLFFNYKEKYNLLKNHMLAWIIARIPFLFFPFINNIYYVFFAAGIYQLFYRAGFPAWVEIFKRKIKNQKSRHNIFSLFTVIGYIESILLGLFIGRFLDNSRLNWKIVFFFSALLGLTSLFIQRKIVIEDENNENQRIKNNFFTPIKDIIKLLQTRKDFAIFQKGFMIGGFALMFINPALYIFSNNILNLSYTNMTVARFVIMGIGFAASSFYWKKALEKTSVNFIMLFVLSGFTAYILCLFLSKYFLSFFYLAFLLYGISQAGSVLLWKLSGIIFSKEENSVLFTSTNLLFVGIRGLIAPLLGSIFCSLFGVSFVLFIGVLISFYGFFVSAKFRKTTYSYGD
jgi:MFS family permease